MEAFFIYLAKSCLILSVFAACFYLFLKHDTLFKSHRLFLVTGIISAFVFPQLFITKNVFITATASSALSVPLINQEAIIEPNMDWSVIALVCYALVVFVLLFRFLIQLLSLRKLIRSGKTEKEGQFTMLSTPRQTAPFSFFNYIVYNPSLHSKVDLDAIIAHEKIHAIQKHSLDILLVHILCIFQWMNPLAWWYKKTVAQNLEYLADKGALAKTSCKKQYQYVLLGQHIPAPTSTLYNTFFNSLIKKRIVMINKTKSNKKLAWKYLSVVPALIIFLVTINTKIVAQSNGSTATYVEEINENYDIKDFTLEIHKNSSDSDIENEISFVKKEMDIQLKFYKIKRNSKGEIIAIKSSFNDGKGRQGKYSVSQKKPIQPFHFYVSFDENKKVKDMGYQIVDKDYTINASKIEIRNKSEVDQDKPLIVIDGKVTSRDIDLNAVDPNTISSVNVLKGKNATARYGDKGLNGVVEITMKTAEQMQAVVHSGTAIELSNMDNAIFIVDGKEQDASFNADNLNTENIASITVFKGDKAIEKYGEKGKNGVVVITLK